MVAGRNPLVNLDTFQGKANLVTASVGPARRLQQLKACLQSQEDKRLWRIAAKFEAIVGSCPRSVASVRSGIKHYVIILC